ncbi:MAG: hypothetical protein WC261_04430 [Synergistaceae bacterium]|jgi:hypothetical protein
MFGLKTIRNLKKENAQMQAYLDILEGRIITSVESQSSKYRGNEYTSYDSIVTQLDKMYSGTADWGNLIAKNIIDVRAAFTIGQGVRPVYMEGFNEDTASREMEFIKAFLIANNLDNEVPQDWAREAEVEGKFCCKLIPDNGKKQIKVRYLSYTDTKYKVITPEDDYAVYERVEYNINSSLERIEKGSFVYKRFGGRTTKVNETTPKAGLCLGMIEGIDKALWDWRKINHLFSAPTPHFECETPEQAEKLNELLKKINWKIGKYIATTGKFSFVESTSQTKESIENEIITRAKMVSGIVGLPVHFLGLPDLMSNRSTSTDLFELINASTSKERTVWIGGYEELFQKVLAMANLVFNMSFNPEAIGVEIPFVSEQKMKQIVEIWLPLYTARAIDLDTLLSKIPDVDVETVKENLAEVEAGEMEKARMQLEQLKTEQMQGAAV